MDQLKAMESFLCVARARSFALAARELGVSRALVSNRIQNLEKRIGALLLHRTPRSLSLTEIGTVYLEFCRRILGEIEGEERALRELQEEPRGNLRVIIPKSFGPLHMSAAISAFANQYPDIRLTVMVQDTLLHTLSSLTEKTDVAVRLAHTSDSSLMARKLATIQWLICAAPAYLDRHGEPEVPRALAGHNCMTHLTLDHDRVWRFKGRRSEVTVRVQGSYHANSVVILRDAACAGIGIAMLPSYCVVDELRRGLLRPLLTGWRIAEQPLYAVYPFGKVPPQKVRLFVDFLVDWFHRPRWEGG